MVCPTSKVNPVQYFAGGFPAAVSLASNAAFFFLAAVGSRPVASDAASRDGFISPEATDSAYAIPADGLIGR